MTAMQTCWQHCRVAERFKRSSALTGFMCLFSLLRCVCPLVFSLHHAHFSAEYLLNSAQSHPHPKKWQWQPRCVCGVCLCARQRTGETEDLTRAPVCDDTLLCCSHLTSHTHTRTHRHTQTHTLQGCVILHQQTQRLHVDQRKIQITRKL